MSERHVKDEIPMLYMMDVLEGISLGDVIGDGAYDTLNYREIIYDMGGRQVIPPPKSERLQRKTQIAGLLERDEVIRDLALYTDYEGDYTMPYSWILGCEVSSLEEIPEGLVSKLIPGSKHAVFTTKGGFPQELIAVW